MTTSTRSEIEPISAEPQRIEPQFKQNIRKSLEDIASAIDEQLDVAVTAAEHAVRKQVLGELREKYGKELEIALAERDRLVRRLQVTTKQFEEQKLAWTTNAGGTEQAMASLAKLQAQADQLRAEKQELEARLKEAQAHEDETEKAGMRLQEDLKQIQDEKKKVEAMLANANSHFTEMEESLIRLRSELELEQSGKQEIESKLAEAGTVAVQSRLTLERLQADLHDARTEANEALAARTELEGRLREVNASQTALETKLTEVQSTCSDLKAQLKKTRNGRPAPKAEPPVPAVPQEQAGISTTSLDNVDQEIARVESILADVAKLLDDPDVTLSEIMRKSVEKSEFEAYLRGVRFVLGQADPS